MFDFIELFLHVSLYRMSKAGEALKQVLDEYNIRQTELARILGVGRSTVHGWISGYSAPTSDGVLEIRNALRQINPEAAEEFIRLYLED